MDKDAPAEEAMSVRTAHPADLMETRPVSTAAKRGRTGRGQHGGADYDLAVGTVDFHVPTTTIASPSPGHGGIVTPIAASG
jgi:hypothetical protein